MIVALVDGERTLELDVDLHGEEITIEGATETVEILGGLAVRQLDVAEVLGLYRGRTFARICEAVRLEEVYRATGWW